MGADVEMREIQEGSKRNQTGTIQVPSGGAVGEVVVSLR